MQVKDFYRTVTVDDAGALDQILSLLGRVRAPYCVIGGQAVNAYVDPLVSLDLDIVVAAADLPRVIDELPRGALVSRFPHSVNVDFPGSGLRLQFQTDERYAGFPARATEREVLGTTFRIAALEDVLAGKVWAASDETRRASKRQKDLADIARLIERFPALRARVPKVVLDKLL